MAGFLGYPKKKIRKHGSSQPPAIPDLIELLVTLLFVTTKGDSSSSSSIDIAN